MSGLTEKIIEVNYEKEVYKCAVGFITNVCFYCYFFTNSVFAAVSNTPATDIDAISKPYTNSDILYNYTYNGVLKTIHNYNTLKTNYQNDKTRDDPITAIIPRQLFSARGEYFHVGKEYGFYVHTRAVNTSANPSGLKPTPYSNLVTVFVFDIQQADVTNSTNVQLKISPIFCYDYAYVSAQTYFGSSYMSYWQPYYSNWEYGNIVQFQQKSFVANGLSDIVIGLPDGRYYSNYEGDHFDERWQMNARYHMRDISTAAELLNVDKPNFGDSNYVASQDQGAFFNMVFFEHNGTTAKQSADITAIQMALSYAKISPHFTIGDLTTLHSIIVNIVNDATNNKVRNEEIKGTVGQEYNLDMLQNDSQYQLSQYGKLLKTASASLEDHMSNYSPTIYQPTTGTAPYFDFQCQFNTNGRVKTQLSLFAEFRLMFRSSNSIVGNYNTEIGVFKGRCGDPTIITF